MICGELLVSQIHIPGMQMLCPVCKDERPRYESAVAYGPYEGRLLDLVHVFKYQRVLSAVHPLGGRLAEALAKITDEVGKEAIIVPVPLHRSKLKQRGFNQAVELAKSAKKRLQGNAETWCVCEDVLERVRSTTSQTGLSRNQRMENVRGAFVVKEAARIRGKHIVIVDDVMTTGVTANECARVLRRAGAEKVWVATVARVTRMFWGVSASTSDTQKTVQ